MPRAADSPLFEKLFEGKTFLLEGRFEKDDRAAVEKAITKEGGTLAKKFGPEVDFIYLNKFHGGSKHAKGRKLCGFLQMDGPLNLGRYDAAAVFADDKARWRIDGLPYQVGPQKAMRVSGREFKGRTFTDPKRVRGSWVLDGCSFENCKLVRISVWGDDNSPEQACVNQCRFVNCRMDDCWFSVAADCELTDCTITGSSHMRFEGGRGERVDFEGEDGPVLRNITLTDSTLRGCEFPQMRGATLERCELVDLGGDRFFGAWREGVRVRQSEGTVLRDTVVRGAVLDGVTFSGGELERVTFEDCRMVELTLRDGCRASDCVFRDCEIKVLDVSEASLDGCRWEGLKPQTVVAGGDAIEGLEAGPGGAVERPAAREFAEVLKDWHHCTLEWAGVTRDGKEAAMKLKNLRACEVLGEAGLASFECDLGDRRSWTPDEMVRTLVRLFEELDVVSVPKKGMRVKRPPMTTVPPDPPTADFKTLLRAAVDELAAARA